QRVVEILPQPLPARLGSDSLPRLVDLGADDVDNLSLVGRCHLGPARHGRHPWVGRTDGKRSGTFSGTFHSTPGLLLPFCAVFGRSRSSTTLRASQIPRGLSTRWTGVSNGGARPHRPGAEFPSQPPSPPQQIAKRLPPCPRPPKSAQRSASSTRKDASSFPTPGTWARRGICKASDSRRSPRPARASPSRRAAPTAACRARRCSPISARSLRPPTFPST